MNAVSLLQPSSKWTLILTYQLRSPNSSPGRRFAATWRSVPNQRQTGLLLLLLFVVSLRSSLYLLFGTLLLALLEFVGLERGLRMLSKVSRCLSSIPVTKADRRPFSKIYSFLFLGNFAVACYTRLTNWD
ncbi:hypothetical protein BKA59DRAFT_464762 [Fusarium tricinctum]|uniref:Uncharacterized protein n=1 Tax=Fusarium tricinctum TaxID=61284 RepID=A0A8K0S8V4_9HYPO|nr:hypothetical protein BKA59DRAFT_464762 [Fusarium tricinctum]